MKYFIWAILWAVVVLSLTCLPMDNTTEKVPHFEGMDKLVHTGFFFVFSVLLCLGYSQKKKTHKAQFDVFMKTLIFSMLFAFLTEFLQYKFFTYRSGDWWDIFADMTGAGMGLFSYLVLHRNYKAKV